MQHEPKRDNETPVDVSDEEFDYAAAEGLPDDMVKGGKHKSKTKSQNHPHSERSVKL